MNMTESMETFSTMEDIQGFINHGNVVIKEEIDICDIIPDYEKSWFTCYHCEEEFLSLNDLKHHIRRSHLQKYQKEESCFTCYHCKVEILSLNDLKHHIKRSHLQKYQSTPKENNNNSLKSKSRRGRPRNLRSVNPGKRSGNPRKSKKRKFLLRVLPCNLLSSFAYFTAKRPPKKKKVPCLECEFESDKLVKVMNHMKLVHNNTKPYVCPFCDQSSLRLTDLQRHYISRHTAEKAFSCIYCDFSTSRSLTLRRHLQACHSSEMPISYYKIVSCPLCSYSTSRVDHVKSHIKRVHNSRLEPITKKQRSSDKTKENIECDQDTFRCPHCQFHTSYTSSLKRHVETVHSSRRKYYCSYCKYSSAFSHDIKNHERRKH